MYLQEFNAMFLNEIAASIWKRGTFLSTRTEGSFFCEMLYHPGANKIVLVQGFTSHALPEPYLDTIELPRL